MDETTCDPSKFDVEAEYKRLSSNLTDLYNKNILSITAGRKAAEKLRHWRKVNLHNQINTETGN